MSASEELIDIEKSEDQEDFEDPTRYIFESDVTAIQTFIRELVTQSVIPTMERNISLEQRELLRGVVASAAGSSNLGRRFAFGSSSRNSSGGGSGSSNYDVQGLLPAGDGGSHHAEAGRLRLHATRLEARHVRLRSDPSGLPERQGVEAPCGGK